MNRRTILIAFLWIFNVFIFVDFLKWISYARSTLVVKNVCVYAPVKSVTVFVDVHVKKEFGEDVSPENILKTANYIFAEHLLPFGYDLSNARIREWNSDEHGCFFSKAKFEDQKECVRRKIAPLLREEKRSHNPDVVIFLTARSDVGITGAAFIDPFPFLRKNHGNGSIILDLGTLLSYYREENRPHNSARLYFLTSFATLLTHEQSHLYGASHVLNPLSIMYEYSDNFGDHRVRFDQKSLEELQRTYQKLETEKSQCAAR